MKTVLALHCPSCGAELSVDEEKEITYCIYCGTKILLKDQNETTTRHINEADVIRAKTERELAMKELALKEKENKKKQTKLLLRIAWGVASVICAVLGYGVGFSSDDGSRSGFIMLGIIGLFSGLACLITAMNNDSEKSKSQQATQKTDLLITEAMENWKRKPFPAVSSVFRAGGFRNIQTIPLYDLKSESDRNNGVTSSVLINGSEDWEEGEEYPADAPILILYHSAKQ